jgi:hypothetical protein
VPSWIHIPSDLSDWLARRSDDPHRPLTGLGIAPPSRLWQAVMQFQTETDVFLFGGFHSAR